MGIFSTLTSDTPRISNDKTEVQYYLRWYGDLPPEIDFRMEMDVRRSLMKKHNIPFRRDTEEVYSRGEGKIEVIYKLYPKF